MYLHKHSLDFYTWEFRIARKKVAQLSHYYLRKLAASVGGLSMLFEVKLNISRWFGCSAASPLLGVNMLTWHKLSYFDPITPCLVMIL